jgi:hypothetical protein
VFQHSACFQAVANVGDPVSTLLDWFYSKISIIVFKASSSAEMKETDVPKIDPGSGNSPSDAT